MIDATAKLSKGKKRKPTKKAIAKAVEADDRVPSEQELRVIGQHCSTTERNSESAERQLRQYLVMELLSEKLGEDFEGTITGVTGQGVFMQIDRYLVDGFIHVNDLPSAGGDGGGSKKGKKKKGGGSAGHDRWVLNRQTGALVAQRSGKVMNIGDRFIVRVSSVDLPRRQLELAVIKTLHAAVKSAPADERGGEQKTTRRGSAERSRKPRRGSNEAAVSAEAKAPAPDGQGKGKGAGKKKRRGSRGGKGKRDNAGGVAVAEAPPKPKKKHRKGGSTKTSVVIKQRRHRGKNKRK